MPLFGSDGPGHPFEGRDDRRECQGSGGGDGDLHSRRTGARRSYQPAAGHRGCVDPPTNRPDIFGGSRRRGQHVGDEPGSVSASAVAPTIHTPTSTAATRSGRPPTGRGRGGAVANRTGTIMRTCMADRLVPLGVRDRSFSRKGPRALARPSAAACPMRRERSMSSSGRWGDRFCAASTPPPGAVGGAVRRRPSRRAPVALDKSLRWSATGAPRRAAVHECRGSAAPRTRLSPPSYALCRSCYAAQRPWRSACCRVLRLGVAVYDTSPACSCDRGMPLPGPAATECGRLPSLRADLPAGRPVLHARRDSLLVSRLTRTAASLGAAISTSARSARFLRHAREGPGR